MYLLYDNFFNRQPFTQNLLTNFAEAYVKTASFETIGCLKKQENKNATIK